MANLQFFTTVALSSVLLQLALVSGQTLCRVGEETCDGRCYNPDKFQCIRNSSARSDTLCRYNESLCSDDGSISPICYDPEFQDCYVSNGWETVCNKGLSLCDSFSNTCFNSTTHNCHMPNSVICLKGQELCDRTCYFPEVHTCNTGSILCRPGEEVCDRSCFNPKQFQCYRGSSSSYDKLCRLNEAICSRPGSSFSAICYDPEIEECHTTTNSEIVCRPGELVCGSSSLSCYNPLTHKCVKGDTSSYYTLCILGQELCGSTCYFPQSNICVT